MMTAEVPVVNRNSNNFCRKAHRWLYKSVSSRCCQREQIRWSGASMKAWQAGEGNREGSRALSEARKGTTKPVKGRWQGDRACKGQRTARRGLGEAKMVAVSDEWISWFFHVLLWYHVELENRRLNPRLGVHVLLYRLIIKGSYSYTP